MSAICRGGHCAFRVMAMRQHKLPAMLLGLSLFLSACGGTPTQPARTSSGSATGSGAGMHSSSAPLATYTDKRYKFSFSYPTDFSPVPITKYHLWNSLCNKDKHLCIEIRTDVARNTTNQKLSLGDWYLQDWGVPAGTWDEKKQTEPNVEQLTVDGGPAIRSSTVSADGVFSLYAVMAIQNKLLFLTVDYNGIDAYSAGMKHVKPLSDEVLATFHRG